MTKRMLVVGIMAGAAFGAALTAHADYWAWNGSSTSPSYWDDMSLWVKSGTTTDFTSWNHNFKEKYSTGKAFASGWDRTVTFRNAFAFTSGDLAFSAGSPQSPIMFVAENAEYGLTTPGKLFMDGDVEENPCLHIKSGTYGFVQANIATTAGITGTLMVSGGTVLANNNGNPAICIGSAGAGNLNVSGGTVSSKGYIHVGSGGPGYLNISGGLVKNAANYIRIAAYNNGTGTVTVTSGGTYENLEGNGSITVGHSAGSVGTLNVRGGAVTTKGQI
ncbi:MAG: hypothetical protein IJ658_03895, partial [Kiritimatiellae bacterium]|nr:hypothetical protein [Kiritimatiellia bacterium]